MRLATCRFNKKHKVKRSRLEIHEQACPDRYYVNPEDMIHKDKYLTSTEVKYDKEIIADIRKYIANEGNDNTNKFEDHSCEVQNERVPIGGVPKKKKKKKPYQKEKEFLNNEMTFKNENKIQREDIEVISGGGIPNSSSITNSLNKNISSIDSDFSFDTTNKQSSIMISNVDDSNTIQYLYNPNEEDRLIEEKNKHYINLTSIKNRLSK